MQGNDKFQGSTNWWNGFKARNNLSYRKVNASSLKGLEFEAKLVREYFDLFIPLLKPFKAEKILSFDETRYVWDPNIKYTYDFKGINRVLGVNSTKINHFITILFMVASN